MERYVRMVYSPRAYLSQTGIFLDLESPAVIVHQVEVKLIDFQHSHAVNDSQHTLFRNEKAGNVQH